MNVCEIDLTISGRELRQVLDEHVGRLGAPYHNRSDNREFTEPQAGDRR